MGHGLGLSNNINNIKSTTFRGNQLPAAARENDLSLERPRELIRSQVVGISCQSCCLYYLLVTLLLFIPVFVVDTYQTTGEGEDFAKGDED